MRFGVVIALVAALATTSLADRMTVIAKCPCAACGSCKMDGTFYTDYGATSVNAANGCRKTNVPYMVEFCVDQPLGRAHFRFDYQSKRCLLKRSNSPVGCNYDHCEKSEWEEVACYW